jgi:hypothetical protein
MHPCQQMPRSVTAASRSANVASTNARMSSTVSGSVGGRIGHLRILCGNGRLENPLRELNTHTRPTNSAKQRIAESFVTPSTVGGERNES